MRLRTLTDDQLLALLGQEIVDLLLWDEEDRRGILERWRASERLQREWDRRQTMRGVAPRCVCEDCCRGFSTALSEPPAGAPS